MRWLIIMLLTLPAVAASAYDGEDNAIMFNVAGILTGIPMITYERELNDDMSLAFSVALVDWEDPDTDEALRFNELHVGWRYYFSKKTEAIHGNFFYALIGGGSGEWGDAAVAGRDGAECAWESGGDGDDDQQCVVELECVDGHGWLGSGGLPDLPGWVGDAAGECDGDDVHRHGAGGGDQLRLHGGGL